MFNLDKFIADSVTKRPVSMFAADIEANKIQLTEEIKDKKVCVIGGAGSIGSSFIKAVLRFEPKRVVVVDLNENGLAELVRDVRSTNGLYVPDEFRCYTLNFADPIFERIFREEKGFDIVANFSAHKHVRSEKDRYSVQALIENNDIKAKKLMDLLKVYPPKHFFYVSTDKTANPVNIMGASKRIMEDL
ncbi:MAG: polysaccharide biosynthesis protein, partial [Aeriscardovia sp.]|nr:polysaccharide biosynthesis protein [Aeriscardovia sp.]